MQIAGILTGDAALVGKALDSDIIIEPVRGPLIPGFAAVKAAAKAAGDTPARLFITALHAVHVPIIATCPACKIVCTW